MKTNPLTPLERKSAISLASIFALRMFGLFMLLPLIRVLGDDLEGATLPLLGWAIGVYGLSQALLQLPLGLLSDKIGRKPVIYGGLIIFIVGSLVAANAETIYGLIAGRALQGAGAIASAVMALAADLSRPEQRSKMMAMIGGSIGLAFALSLVFGPLLSNWLSLNEIFYLIAGLAFVALLVAIFVVPAGGKIVNTELLHEKDTKSESVLQKLAHVSHKGHIYILALAVFVIHWALVAVFLVIPKQLINIGFSLGEHSWIYLLVLFLSILMMLPMMLFAERKGWHKGVMQSALILLLIAVGLMMLEWQSIGMWLCILTLFFAGFNLLEAKLPSTVSNLFAAQYRGTAMGIFTSFQFLGAFFGGTVTGALLPKIGFNAIAVISMLMLLLTALLLGLLANRVKK